MALLHEIQAFLLDEKVSLGPILLKIKFLAAKLGSHTLADWVKYETEGYPDEMEVPEYRRVGITYEGTFTNGFMITKGSPVPAAAVKKHAGEQWLKYSLREPLAVLESYTKEKNSSGRYSIGTGNLMAVIGDKIFTGFGCTHLEGFFSAGAFVEVGAVVRAKLLDLVLELEAQVPEASLVEVGAAVIKTVDQGAVTSITNNVIYGNVNNVSNMGAGANIDVKVIQGDADSLRRGLIAAGLAPTDASELTAIASDEKPEDDKEPFGKRAKAWIAKRLEAGVDGALKIGGEVAKDEIADLFQKFYDWML